MTEKNSTSNELVYNSKLLNIIMEKVTKGKHKHLHPEVGKDSTLRECKRLFKKGASPEVLTEVLIKLKKSPEYYEYYTQCFLPVLKEKIKQSKELEEIKKEKIEQVISEIISQSSNKDLSNNIAQSRRGSIESENSGIESGNSSKAEDDHDASKKHSISSANTISEDQEVENGITGNSEDSGIESDNSSEAENADEKDHISGIPIFHTANEDQEVENGIMNSNVQYTDKIFKVIKNGSQREFEEYLENCTDISSAKDEKENNILHLIVTQLEKKQKFDFLNTVLGVSKKEGKEQLKAQLKKAVNDKNGNGQTPLQALLLSKVTKEKHSFETTPRKILTPLKKLIPHYDNTIVSAIQLLKLGANIDDLQLSEEELQGLGEKQKTYYLNFLEELAEQGKKSKLESETKTNTETKTKETIEYTINTPDSNDNYQLHLAIKNNDKKLFEELLQKGADISLKDTKSNNALHHIALLKKEQKVAYLELILNLVEKGVISQNKLREAIDATNQKENTPLQVALKTKARKGGTKYLKKGKIFDPTVSYSNTTKFCAMLLEMGADPRSLELEGEEFDTRKYYLTLCGLKDYPKTPHKAQEKARELKEELEEEYHCKTPLKKCQSGVKRTGSSIGKAASTIIHKGPALAIMFAVIGIATAAAFNGAMAPVAAICIIVAAISAYFVFTSRSRIKEFLKKSSNETKDHVDNKQQRKHARRPKSEVKDTSIKEQRTNVLKVS
ncbi:ankyrin repeat domain-containing protein [Wolbachia endosymbiont (group A) of Agelastica alni]|uniref:ankyrin repeat domain-containing protein n=1 Tax=Wolbachia endosymbiont (group A) of Agelastica alni TaxID=3066130 RepID=UPI003341D69F